MPPLTLLVLDALADDWESVESMRNHGEVAPDGLALVDEQLIVEAVRSLIDDGLVAVAQTAKHRPELIPVRAPRTDDASLRRYWFRPTEAGDAVWRDGHDVLHAYWDANPRRGRA